jgi:phosphohistidine phosphatase
MKRLTLVRHAQAETALAGQADFDRTLTRRGARDAAEMARRLKQSKHHIDFVLSSPAARTVATAEVFARTLKVTAAHFDTDERLYAADTKEILAVLRECDDRYKNILLVAHNPGITEFADKLSNERRIDAMPTCSIVRMHFKILAWKELAWHSGIEVDLDYPDRAA